MFNSMWRGVSRKMLWKSSKTVGSNHVHIANSNLLFIWIIVCIWNIYFHFIAVHLVAPFAVADSFDRIHWFWISFHLLFHVALLHNIMQMIANKLPRMQGQQLMKKIKHQMFLILAIFLKTMIKHHQAIIWIICIAKHKPQMLKIMGHHISLAIIQPIQSIPSIAMTMELTIRTDLVLNRQMMAFHTVSRDLYSTHHFISNPNSFVSNFK